MDLVNIAPHKSAFWQIWCRSCEKGEFDIATWPDGQRDLWLGRRESLNLSYPSVPQPKLPLCKVWCRKNCGNWDLIFSIFHMLSFNHMIKRTCHSVEDSLSTEVTSPLSLKLTGFVEVDITFLFNPLQFCNTIIINPMLENVFSYVCNELCSFNSC